MSDSASDRYIEERDVWVDPISHEAVDPQRSKHRSFHAGHMYHFASLTNKQQFDEDPELWVPAPHAVQTSAHITSYDDVRE